jgi:hypothetical protein
MNSIPMINHSLPGTCPDGRELSALIATTRPALMSFVGGPFFGNAKAPVPAMMLLGAARTFAVGEARKAEMID